MAEGQQKTALDEENCVKRKDIARKPLRNIFLAVWLQ